MSNPITSESAQVIREPVEVSVPFLVLASEFYGKVLAVVSVGCHVSAERHYIRTGLNRVCNALIVNVAY